MFKARYSLLALDGAGLLGPHVAEAQLRVRAEHGQGRDEESDAERHHAQCAGALELPPHDETGESPKDQGKACEIGKERPECAGPSLRRKMVSLVHVTQ